MNLSGEIHVSAQNADSKTIAQLLQLGFEQDEFRECIRCTAPVFHATYRGEKRIPDFELWENINSAITNYPGFVGCVEEELVEDERQIRSNNGIRDSGNILFPILDLQECPLNFHKASDIHIRLRLDQTSKDSLAALENINLSSFDRKVSGVPHRVFTSTYTSSISSRKVFLKMHEILNLTGAVGKIKLETTQRFVRLPDTAPVLPIANDKAVDKWLKETSMYIQTIVRG